MAHGSVAPQNIHLARVQGGIPLFKLGNLTSVHFSKQGGNGAYRTGIPDDFRGYMSREARAAWEDGRYIEGHEKADLTLSFNT